MKATPWLLVVVLLVGMAAMRGLNSSAAARALQRAETAETAVRDLTLQRDALREDNELLEGTVQRRDSIYAADTAVWAAERREIEARATRATARASGLADGLRAQLDSVGRATLAEYDAEWQAVVTAKDDVIVVLESQVAGLEGLVAARDSLIVGLRAELVAGQAVEAGMRQANDALHDAIRAQNRQTWILRGVGTVLLAKVAYDALQ